MENNIQPNDFFLLISVGILAMLLFAIGLLVIFFTSQRRLLNEKMQQQALLLKHQEEMLYSTIKTQEKERKRIARDLHDAVGSRLNVILLNLRFLKKQSGEEETIDEINELLVNTVDTTRQISHDLLPPVLDDFGLVAAINELKDNYEKTDLVFDFEAKGAIERLDDNLTELNLFRVVQELVKNSVLHGKASNVKLELETSPPNFQISYQDNGKGVDVKKLKESKGMGTLNIESRLNMCGANIDYESEIGKGFKAIITKTA
ncbi:MAG: histidine kinase [Bacteroidia bacterium]|nr:histidine kinase [Bacteroidia bacterium]